MPSTNDVWKRKAAGSDGEEITLPSGQTCIARKIGLEEMIEAGFLNHMDLFTSLVDTETIQPAKAKLQGRNAKKPTLKQRAAEKERAEATANDTILAKLAADPTLVATMATMLNTLTPKIVIEPAVICHLDADGAVIAKADRDPDAIYTDMIDFMDKMDLFTWAMGDIDNLATFRDAANGAVGAVVDGGDVPRPAV